MHYLMIIAHDDAFQPTATLLDAIAAWNADMDAKGVRLHGAPLRPVSDAKTVRVRDGKQRITPGPFSDSREQMCGYELIACASSRQALALAASHPMAAAATVEVRPLWSDLMA